MIGIYKITSPSGKIYIGQSTNIETRWKRHKYYFKHSTNRKIKNSFNKYGPENHVFKIIEECLIENLNIRERHWQDFYDVLGINGLNCILTKTDVLPRIMSQEIKDAIGKANKGKKSWVKGKKQSIESNILRSLANRGKIRTQEQCDKISKALSKPVLQFNLLGEFINEFNSRKEATRLTGIDCQFALLKKCKTSKGFIWIYKSDWDGLKPSISINKNLGKPKPWLKGKPNLKLIGRIKTEGELDKLRKPVIQYSRNFEFIKEWNSAKDILNQLNISVSSCCRGKEKTAGGFIWRFKVSLAH